MTSSKFVFSLLLFFLLSPVLPLKFCKFDNIYQLGDSISDTGNLIRESAFGAVSPFARLPYGETFFKKATGRCSNGLLMIDYIAIKAGIPFLNPYKKTNANFVHGVNFAVAGSTALSTQTLAENHILSPVTNSSLGVQLDWMSAYFNTTCHNHKDSVEKLKHSLFMVGEIGGNDYNYALFQGKTIEESKNLVPIVVETIKDVVRRVINLGAVRVIVPGNFPIGCFPIYLTAFQTNVSGAYDRRHCLSQLNNFSMYHNNKLKQAIKELKHEFPNAIIVYGDYYNAFEWLFNHAPYLGFEVESVQKTCCGIGGEYSFNLTRMCGSDPSVPVCPHSHRRISWDGVHLTQESYKFMSRWLIRDIFPQLHCNV